MVADVLHRPETAATMRHLTARIRFGEADPEIDYFAASLPMRVVTTRAPFS